MAKSAKKSETSLPSDKKNLRICHIADVHLGYRRYNKITKAGLNQREVDVNLAFQECVTRVAALKPDLTIIAGDLFHSVRPSNTVLTFCFRQLRKLVKESGAPVVVVGGNHESPKRADTGSVLQLLGEIEGVYVADLQAERYSFPELGLSVQCLPHAAIADGVPKLRADDRYKHNILVVHAQVEEQWISEFGGVEVALRSLSPHEWSYIALGHVHIQRSVGLNAAYSGAIEHTAANIWSEAPNLKGFLEVDVPNNKRVFHPLTSPREVLVLEPIDARHMEPDGLSEAIKERVDSVAGGIEGKIVRLEVFNIPRDTYRYLNHRDLRTFRSRALNFTLDLRGLEEDQTAVSATIAKFRSLKDDLTAFCGTYDTNGVESAHILKLLISYLDKIEARNEAA